MPITDNSKKKAMLKKISYINYPIQFNQNKVQALVNKNNKINAIGFKYVQKLDLKI